MTPAPRFRSRSRWLVAVFAAAAPAASPAAGQMAAAGVSSASPAARVAVASRVAGDAPVVDGRLDDAVWRSAAWSDGFTQYAPAPGAPASEQTQVAVAYDEGAVYVGVRLYDSSPDSVSGRLGRRDEEVYSDWFYVAVDGYRDGRTGFQFGINPRGVKRDLLLYNDVLEDAGWDAVWDAAARTDSGGWTAEFRIPLSQVRFARGAGRQDERVWGVNFRRHVARRNEVSYWSPVPRDAAGYVSLFGELHGFRGLPAARRLEVRPYTATSLTRAPGAAADPFHHRNDWLARGGADLKYGISSRFTLNATINPDFGQVEADAAVVNLTAYETFLPEKRPFFVEGTDVFYARGPQLFYSRRIGRYPQGSAPAAAVYSDLPAATTILGAAKLTGKSPGGWSMGVLAAATGREEARFVTEAGEDGRAVVEPLTGYAVGRLVRDFRNGRSAVGSLVTLTHREDDPATAGLLRSSAVAGGLDVRHRFGAGRYELFGQVLGSRVQGSRQAIARTQRAAGRYFQRPDAGHVAYDSTRTSLRGAYAAVSVNRVAGGHWRWGIGASATSPGFEVNDLGYHPRVDVVSQNATLAYDAYRPGRLFRRWKLDLYEGIGWTFGGERVSTAVQAAFSFERPSFTGGEIGITRQMEGLSTDLLRGGPAFVRPANTYGWFSLYADRRRPVRLELAGDASRLDEDGGWSMSLSPRVRVRSSPRMDFVAGPTLSRNVNPMQYVAAREFGERRYVFGRLRQTTASITARVNYTVTRDLAIQGYVQPFVSAGRFSRFSQVADSRAARYADRFHRLEPGSTLLDRSDGSYGVDLTGDGEPDYTFRDPDFNIGALQSNVVLRWEYRPGSTLYVAWSHGRSSFDGNGTFSLGRDVERLWDSPPTNTLMIKLSYWWAP